MRRVALLACLLFSLVISSLAGRAEENWPTFTLTEQHEAPVIAVHSPGTEENKYGFEGGRAVKIGNTYHLLVSEMVGDPHWVNVKAAHWTSEDRIHWKRISTLFTGSADYTGKDPRAALWGPMPVFDEKEDRWNVFYVAYRSAPNTKTKWLILHDGRIWRAVSRTKGLESIGGPYDDVGIVIAPGPESDPWEGLQGTDSFFPYLAGDTWYAFYGSANTEKLPVRSWRVGLATAPRLAGPWKRLAKLNPVLIEKVFIENPIITKLDDGTYVAVYDTDTPYAVGYTFSRDGLHWSPGRELIVQPKGKGRWADDVRTPLGLIPEGNHTFTLLYTGYEGVPKTFPYSGHPRYGSVGLVIVKLTHP